MNLRLVLFAALALCAASSGALAQVPLKPFQSTAPQAKSLAGSWKGTFIFERKENGGREEVSYLVEIGPDMGTLKVTGLPPYGSDTDSRLTPITEGAIPADWDGETLKAQTQRSFQDGKADVLVVKKFLLRAGKDSRHLSVSYEVTVKTSKPRSERSETVRGRGELVRVP